MALRRSDYENYDYREFWKDDKRYYEDCSERMALRKLLRNERIDTGVFVDIGCGYGRLFNEYSRFPRIVMVDYSINNLKNARMRINQFLAGYKGKMPRVLYVAADAARLPLRSGSADTILSVRLVHHLEYPGKYFDEVSRLLGENGLFILEFANKRNLKNILRFMAGRMDVSPFNTIPSQVGETIRNYHPVDIFNQLSKRDLVIKKTISVSNFRAGFLKKVLGNNILIMLELIYQSIVPSISLGPSIFLKARHSISSNRSRSKDSARPGNPVEDAVNSSSMAQYFSDILYCPGCSKEGLEFDNKHVTCRSCGRVFVHQKSIIDFRL